MYRWLLEHAVLTMHESWFHDGEELNVKAEWFRRMGSMI